MRPRMLVRALLSGVLACTLLALGAPIASGQKASSRNRLIELLAQDKVVLGWFAPARTPDAAKRAAGDPQMDFVFVNMEQVSSYNAAEVKAFHAALRGGTSAPRGPAFMLRLPIFHDDPAAARQRVTDVLGIGVDAVVFPDMESADEARQALEAMGKPRVYPHNPTGDLASIFIVESEKGIANSREITRERPTVAIPGPGTLSRVYNRDMAKVENAIQTQLASCKEFKVPCGITANASDVAKRITEGFRVIIIYDRDYPETMKAAREAAGRE
jgi:2-keto-3-deoxy-L-rhamnonate aldolase RhmA